MRAELRHLAALDAVVDEGSFARAAARLGYTQSALSQQIGALERIVGMRLLERRTGRSPLGPTEAGALLLRHAERIVASLQAADADLEALREGATGALRVGTFQTVGTGVLPTLLARLGVEHPELEVSLVEAVRTEQLIALVETGGVDVSFVVLPAGAEPLEIEAVMDDPWMLVVPAGSPLAGRTSPVAPRELADLTLVAYKYALPYSPEDHLQILGVEPRVLLRSDETATVLGLVAAGVASAILPWLVVDPADPRISVARIDHLLPPRRIGLVWHRDRYHSTVFHQFVRVARDVCAELSAQARTR
ncbi:MAG TPA: LysR family transcriptional regulator [Solirubrobacteraceae bacterium]|nr:LysR family transcriptional regulator [Solirubrobacteraceae bacterium]